VDFSGTTLILSKTVPAGAYVINAKLMLTNLNQGGAVHVNCQLTPDPPLSLFDESDVDLPALSNTSGSTAIPLQATVSFDATTTVRLACGPSQGTPVAAIEGRLNLTQVGAIS